MHSSWVQRTRVDGWGWQGFVLSFTFGWYSTRGWVQHRRNAQWSDTQTAPCCLGDHPPPTTLPKSFYFPKGSSLVSTIFHLLRFLRWYKLPHVGTCFLLHVKHKEVCEPVVCLVSSSVWGFTPVNDQMRALITFHSELVCQQVWRLGTCMNFFILFLCSFILVIGVTA